MVVVVAECTRKQRPSANLTRPYLGQRHENGLCATTSIVRMKTVFARKQISCAHNTSRKYKHCNILQVDSVENFHGISTESRGAAPWNTMEYLHGIYHEDPWHTMELGVSMEYHGMPWSAMEYPWSTMEFRGVSVAVHGSPWHSMVLHRNSMVLHGISMELHGTPWSSMEFHGIDK